MTLELRVAGGRPPASHEVLLVDPGGAAWYLTGLPWPGSPPFDEIGAYRVDLGAGAAERLAGEAGAILGSPPAPPGPADAGLEVVRLDGQEADWSPEERPAPAERLMASARSAIAAAREHPWSVVHGALVDPARVRLVNRGGHPLAIEGGEVRAGWGRRDRPPSPLRLAERPPLAAPLPPALEPETPVELAIGPPGAPQDDDYDTPYALVHLRWRPPVADEGPWLDGWLVAG